MTGASIICRLIPPDIFLGGVEKAGTNKEWRTLIRQAHELPMFGVCYFTSAFH